MIEIGQKVRFVPTWNTKEKEEESSRCAKTITGTVVYVNHANRNFAVEYPCGGSKQRETFQFFDIGKDIYVIRGGKHGR